MSKDNLIHWVQNLYDRLKDAYEIAEIMENPLMNDAGGSMDCFYIKGKLEDCIDLMERNYSSIRKKR